MEGYKEEAKAAFERVKTMLNEDGWTPVEHKAAADIKAWKRSLPGKSVEVVKATGVVDGVQPGELNDKVFNQPYEEKKKADDSFIAEELLETVDDNSKILYQAYSAPWPVSNRDLVLLRSKWEEDGVHYQVDISTKHASKPDPVGSNVRADLIGCYRYAPHDKGTEATYMVFMDPMGNIPGFVVNANVGKVPARVEAFRKM